MEGKPVYYHNVFDGRKVRFYDFCNGFATLGQAGRLRKKCVDLFPENAKRIVDLACGTGSTTELIGKRFRDAEIYAVDLSEKMLGFARKKAEKSGIKVNFLQENIERTSLKPDYFDVVTISFGLHEMPKKLVETVLSEANRVLKKNGSFVFFDFHKPKRRLPRTALDLFMKWAEPHGKEFIESDMEWMLEKNGFTEIEKKTFLMGALQITSATKGGKGIERAPR